MPHPAEKYLNRHQQAKLDACFAALKRQPRTRLELLDMGFSTFIIDIAEFEVALMPPLPEPPIGALVPPPSTLTLGEVP
jgi:hypothetical protein